jgi:hypothetical protein
MTEPAVTSDAKDVKAGQRHGPGMIGAEPAAGADQA